MGRKLDLSGLTEYEAEHVLQVVQRDMRLRKKEEERLSELKQELEDEGSRCSLLSRQHRFNERCCIRCCSPFTFLLNPKRRCPGCGFNVCRACRPFSKADKACLCSTCRKTRLLKTQSLEWYYSNVKRRFKRFGSAKVLKTLYRKHLAQDDPLADLTEGSAYEESVCNEGSVCGSDSAFYRQSEEHSIAETLTVAMRVAEEAIDEAISTAKRHTSNQEMQNEALYLQDHRDELIQELAKTIMQQIIHRRRVLSERRPEKKKQQQQQHGPGSQHLKPQASSRARASLWRSHSAFSLLDHDPVALSSGHPQDPAASLGPRKEGGGLAVSAWKSVDCLDDSMLKSPDGNWIALHSAQLPQPGLLTKRKSQVYSVLEWGSGVHSAHHGMGACEPNPDGALGSALLELRGKAMDSNQNLQVAPSSADWWGSQDGLHSDSDGDTGSHRSQRSSLAPVWKKGPPEFRHLSTSRRTSIIDVNFNPDGRESCRADELEGYRVKRSKKKKTSSKEQATPEYTSMLLDNLVKKQSLSNHVSGSMTPDMLTSEAMTPEPFDSKAEVNDNVSPMHQELTYKLHELARRVSRDYLSSTDDELDREQEEERGGRTEDEEEEKHERLWNMDHERHGGRMDVEVDGRINDREEEKELVRSAQYGLASKARVNPFLSTAEELDGMVWRESRDWESEMGEEEDSEGEMDGQTEWLPQKLRKLTRNVYADQFSSTEDELDRLGIGEGETGEERGRTREKGMKEELAFKLCRLANQVPATQFSSTEDELDRVGREANEEDNEDTAGGEEEKEEEEEEINEETLWMLEAEKEALASKVRDLAGLVSASQFSSTDDELDKVGKNTGEMEHNASGQVESAVGRERMWFTQMEGGDTERSEGRRDSIGELDVRLFDFEDEEERELEGVKVKDTEVTLEKDMSIEEVKEEQVSMVILESVREDTNETDERRTKSKFCRKTGTESKRETEKNTEAVTGEEENREAKKKVMIEAHTMREGPSLEIREAGKGKDLREEVGGITSREQERSGENCESEKEDEEFERIISDILMMTLMEEQKEIEAQEKVGREDKRQECQVDEEDNLKNEEGEHTVAHSETEVSDEIANKIQEQEEDNDREKRKTSPLTEGVDKERVIAVTEEYRKRQKPSTMMEREETKTRGWPCEHVRERRALDEFWGSIEGGQRICKEDQGDNIGTELPKTNKHEETSHVDEDESQWQTAVLTIKDMPQDKKKNKTVIRTGKKIEEYQERQQEVVKKFDRIIGSMDEEKTSDTVLYAEKTMFKEKEEDGRKGQRQMEDNKNGSRKASPPIERGEKERMHVSVDEDDGGRKVHSIKVENTNTPTGQPEESYGETHRTTGDTDGDIDPLTGKTEQDIDPVTGHTKVDIDPVTGDTREDVDPLTRDTEGDVDLLTGETEVDIDPVKGDTNIDMDSLTGDTEGVVDPVTGNTKGDVDSVTGNTKVDIDRVTGDIEVDIDHLTGDTKVDVDPVTGATMGDFNSVTGETEVDVDHVTRDTEADVDHVTRDTEADVDHVTRDTEADVDHVARDIKVDIDHLTGNTEENIDQVTGETEEDVDPVTRDAMGDFDPLTGATKGDVEHLTGDTEEEVDSFNGDAERYIDHVTRDTEGGVDPVTEHTMGDFDLLIGDTNGNIGPLTGKSDQDIDPVTGYTEVDIDAATGDTKEDVDHLPRDTEGDGDLLTGVTEVDIDPVTGETEGVVGPLTGDTEVEMYPVTEDTNVDIDHLIGDTEEDIDRVPSNTEGDVDPVTGHTMGDFDPLIGDTEGETDPLTRKTERDIDPVTGDTKVDIDPVTGDTKVDIDPLTRDAEGDVDPVTGDTEVDIGHLIRDTEEDIDHVTGDTKVDVDTETGDIMGDFNPLTGETVVDVDHVTRDTEADFNNVAEDIKVDIDHVTGETKGDVEPVTRETMGDIAHLTGDTEEGIDSFTGDAEGDIDHVTRDTEGDVDPLTGITERDLDPVTGYTEVDIDPVIGNIKDDVDHLARDTVGDVALLTGETKVDIDPVTGDKEGVVDSLTGDTEGVVEPVTGDTEGNIDHLTGEIKVDVDSVIEDTMGDFDHLTGGTEEGIDSFTGETEGDVDLLTRDTEGDVDPLTEKTERDIDPVSGDTEEDVDPDTVGDVDPLTRDTDGDDDPLTGDTEVDVDHVTRDTEADVDYVAGDIKVDIDHLIRDTEENIDQVTGETEEDVDPVTRDAIGDFDLLTGATKGEIVHLTGDTEEDINTLKGDAERDIDHVKRDTEGVVDPATGKEGNEQATQYRIQKGVKETRGLNQQKVTERTTGQGQIFDLRFKETVESKSLLNTRCVTENVEVDEEREEEREKTKEALDNNKVSGILEKNDEDDEKKEQEIQYNKTHNPQGRAPNVQDGILSPEEIQNATRNVELENTLQFITTLLQQRYSAVSLRSITTEVLKVLNATEELIHGIEGGDYCSPLPGASSPLPRASSHADTKKLDDQLCRLEENVYVAAGTVFGLEAELGDLELYARRLSSETSDKELAFLEEQVASAAAQVQQSELQVSDIAARIAALKNAGLNVNASGHFSKIHTVPVMPVTLDSSRQLRRRLPAPPMTDKEY